MEDLTNVNKRAHKLILNNRRTCNLTGINDVLSFDENEIKLDDILGLETKNILMAWKGLAYNTKNNCICQYNFLFFSKKF